MIVTHSVLAQSKSIGELQAKDDRFWELVDKNAKIEVLAKGFTWSEGPIWVKAGNYLLFSDVPENTIYKWQEGKDVEVFLKPSGYTGKMPYSNEPGSNGLIIGLNGELLACEHGDRRVTSMPLEGRGGKYTLSDNYRGKRFNSPNDLVQKSNGSIFFTDPPYGLDQKENDPSREIDEFGVYLIQDGKTQQVIGNLTRPNGVALSPDEKTLYVAQSDPEAAYIIAYDLDENDYPINEKILFDATPLVKAGFKGLPDGLKTDVNGNIFTTGPGGVLVLSHEGEHLGTIATGEATANCNWGDTGSTLYITADSYLLRIPTKTKGNGF